MSTKLILALGAVALLAYFGVSYGFQQRFPRLEVAADTALTGRVSGVFHIQKSHFFFLNGQTNTRYDFDAFGPAPNQEPLQQGNGRLNQYLRVGDAISKRAHSVELTVRRGKHLSQWVCPRVAAGQ